MHRILGIFLLVVSSVFAVVMVMRAVGRFLVFLAVDQPEIGAGFLLSTFATTGIGLVIAWQVGKKGRHLMRGEPLIEEEEEDSTKIT